MKIKYQRPIIYSANEALVKIPEGFPDGWYLEHITNDEIFVVPKSEHYDPELVRYCIRKEYIFGDDDYKHLEVFRVRIESFKDHDRTYCKYLGDFSDISDAINHIVVHINLGHPHVGRV